MIRTSNGNSMKTVIVENKHTSIVIDFITNELLLNITPLENIIILNQEKTIDGNVFLYDCFTSLSKKYEIEHIEKNFLLWFPYGILVSPDNFSYEVVKKYILYLANTYKLVEKDLLLHPESFLTIKQPPELLKNIVNFYDNYKSHNNNLNQLIKTLENNEKTIIHIDDNKLLKSKTIINVTEKNKHFVEFLIEEEVLSGNSIIDYNGKELFLLEYILLRSLTCAKDIIKKLMLTVNKKNLTQIQQNIKNVDLSYLNNFKEELENFNENMHLLEKKMILLKFEEEDRSSSGSSSKSVVKI